MSFKEVFAFICMAAWITAGVMAMNHFGFQNHLHDLVWSLGAAIALLIIIMVGVAIFFAVAKESPWVWFRDSK